jgi:hypothetical protein
VSVDDLLISEKQEKITKALAKTQNNMLVLTSMAMNSRL